MERIEMEVSGGCQCGVNGRLFLIFGDGCFRSMLAVDFRDGIEVVSGRESPPPRDAHEKAVIDVNFHTHARARRMRFGRRRSSRLNSAGAVRSATVNAGVG